MFGHGGSIAEDSFFERLEKNKKYPKGA